MPPDGYGTPTSDIVCEKIIPKTAPRATAIPLQGEEVESIAAQAPKRRRNMSAATSIQSESAGVGTGGGGVVELRSGSRKARRKKKRKRRRKKNREDASEKVDGASWFSGF
jgi:hypothetical protein